MGNHAMRYVKSLTAAQKMEVRDFYFGGLDQYRMAANSDDNDIVPAQASPSVRMTLIFSAASGSQRQKPLFRPVQLHLTYKELPRRPALTRP